MFLKLRILFSIVAALCLAVILPAAVWGGWIWFFLLAGGAFLFFMLTLLCKQAQEKREQGEQAPPTDFFNPSEKSEAGENTKENSEK